MKGVFNMMKKYIVTAALTLTVLGLMTGCGSKNDIGENKAKEIALETAGVDESDATRFQVSKDRDDGKTLYEIRFDVNEKEYEYEINAENGDIVSSDVGVNADYQAPADASANSQNANQTQNQQPQANAGTDTQNNAQANVQNNTQNATNTNVKISEADAKKAALDRVPGATENDLRMELEMDDGKYIYEGDIIYQQVEYDFEIDANTGTFLKWSQERE